MPPDDPLGRHGPTLENFLRKVPKTQKKQPCPYGERTYHITGPVCRRVLNDISMLACRLNCCCAFSGLCTALLKSCICSSTGRKCTYGIKCKFSHPERPKQSSRSLADELRESAKHPSPAQKLPSARSSPVPGQSLLLVEDMAKKLTLGHESGSPKKDQKHEHQVKASHRSSKRATSRKEKTSQLPSSEQSSARHGGSQEQLDSGLGSIDSQTAPWSDHQYTHSMRQQYGPPRSAPCSCCSHGPSSQGTTPGFQHHTQQYSLGPVSSHSSDIIPYGPPQYASYGAYPVSMSAYSQPPDFQHSRAHNPQQRQQYWSDPFGAHPLAARSLPRWEPPPPPQRTQLSPANGEEREVVRKKLLAIFSANLVDTAMDMFPQLMDPQMLVAEILMLQSQNKSLR